MHALPETGYFRLPQIIGNSKANPPIPALIPVSRSTWWAGVKSGRFPKPVKLGPRITVWRAEDIRELIHQGSEWTKRDNPNKNTTNRLAKRHEVPISSDAQQSQYPG